ncbi:hypothetical protein [Vreelandella populi]|uniref:DUF4376 domain-containing protein n=1 Tax=Vreelandella populi TaxID=2498858 RepID=A0A433L7Y0_9GAMM|nr:hypothetical protein [Halomonas populi]RUR43383.1 hypothetical protein ELY37_16835 [Halomonas populi]
MSAAQPTWFTPPKTAAEKLADAQAAKIQQINAAYTEQVQPLVKDYPDIEQATWIAQEIEARAYLAWHVDQHGAAPATPVLDNILTGRNGDGGSETLQELSQAVLENADMFTHAQQLTGKRQRLVKQVRETKVEEALDGISW